MKKMLVVLFVLAVFGGAFYCATSPKVLACRGACSAARDKCIAPEEKKVREKGKMVTKKVEKTAAEKAACEVSYTACYNKC